MIDLSKLQELAKKATPGPYIEFTGQRGLYADRKYGPKSIAIFSKGNRYDSEKTPTLDNLAYFAALSPDVVLALLSVVRASQDFVDHASGNTKVFDDSCPYCIEIKAALEPFQGGPNGR